MKSNSNNTGGKHVNACSEGKCYCYGVEPKSKPNTPIERKLIKQLGEIKIDHTDFDENGFNRLCSEEVIKIVDIFEAFLTSELERVRRETIKSVKLPVYDHSKCPIKETCIGYQNAESDLENIKEELLAKL